MAFWPFEVSTVHIVYALLGAFIVLFGMFSLFLRERLYIGEAIWAFLFGVIIGPYCADIFNPRSWASSTATSEEVTNTITLEFTRVVLAIGVFAIGVELPKAYMKKHWRSLFFLLVPVMTWGWFVSAALIFALIPGLNFLSSLAVAACLTPTDPILAAAVVGGKWADKHVPAHIRHLLAAESGCNDGAAFPFLYIALYLTLDKTVGDAIKDWFLLLWLYQVILGAIIGCCLGFSFRHLMKFCQRHDLIDRHSYVAQYVSLAMLTIGVTTLLGSDDLLAAFFCGTAFAWDGFFNKQTEESVFSSVIDTLFNVAAFIYVGAWMPFNTFQDAELTLSVWRLLVIAILVLLLRRLPVMMLLYKWIPDIKTFREAVFSGHFGPIGIGAVFISTLATGILEQAHEPVPHQTELLQKTIQPIVAFMVLCSITIHGLSIPGFSLGRRVHSVSRTWSRRDTVGSTRQAPDWTNQARLVSRAEDIVVNRDRDVGVAGVDLERGELVEKEKEKNASGDDTSFQLDEEAHEKMAESGLSGETRVMQSDSPRTRFIDFGSGVVNGSRPATRPATPLAATRPGTPTAGGPLASGSGDRGQEAMPHPRLHPHQQHPQVAEPDRENPPDGTEDVLEWIEGDQTVVERRRRDGSDVDVTVVRNPASSSGRPGETSTSRWQHELGHNAEDIGHAISRELGHLGARARDAVSPSRRRSGSLRRADSESTKAVAERDQREKFHQQQQHPQYQQQQGDQDTAIADDDQQEDEGWASDPEANNGLPPPSSSSLKMARSGSRTSRPQQHAAHSRRRRASGRRNSFAASDIVEEPRGRPGASIGGNTAEFSAAGPSSGLSAAPQSQPQPQAISFGTLPRLGTSSSSRTNTSTSSSHFFSRPSTSRSSRPGTADSLGSTPRNHRVESIRHGHGHGSSRGTSTPTRESSPSRSVRFVDETEFTNSARALGMGMGLSDSPVEEEELGVGLRGPASGPGADNNV